MEDLPPFLRECEKLPPPITNSKQRKRRAFELVGNVETLLEINNNNNAAYSLFQFLEGDQKGNVIWLSRDIFITEGSLLPDSCLYYFDISRLRSDKKHTRKSYLCVCHHNIMPPPTDVNVMEEEDIIMIRRAMDTLLKIFAQHQDITEIRTVQGKRWNLDKPFPASLDALQTFVGYAQSPREICFEDAGLSIEQWRAVAFNCNQNASLLFIKCGVNGEKFLALKEAMKQNQSPSKLQIRYIFQTSQENMHMPRDMFLDFVAALESTTSLTDLELSGVRCDNALVLRLCEAISKNGRLQKLDLKVGGRQYGEEGLNLSDTEWEFFCTALASHPTLQSLKFNGDFAKSSLSPKRDQLLIQHVSRNKVLCKLHIDRYTHNYLYNYHHVKESVSPFLKLNCFRPVVEAIKQETDSTRRQRLFAVTLLGCGDQVSKSPSLRFWLLKENADLLAELSWPETLFLARWNRLIARMHAVENQMQNCQLLPPSLESLLQKKRRIG